jgi:nucleotide-binding universal stress UspA family protein
MLGGMRGTIVCGVTDAAEGRAAAQLAAAVAARLGLRLVLVHVIAGTPQVAHDEAEKPAGDGIEQTLEAIAREVGDAVEIRIVRGNRADRLAQIAAEEGADVIVLGSRPRGARARHTRARQLRCTLARELEAATVVPILIAPPATRERSGRRLALVGAAAGR